MIKQIAPDPKGTPSRLGSRPSEPRRGTLWVGSGVLVRVIISARRVHRIQRWRSNRCLALEDDIDRRQNAQGRKGGDDQTADDGAGQRRRLSTAFAETDGHGRHAANHGGRGHENGAQTGCGYLDDLPGGSSAALKAVRDRASTS